MLTENQDAYGWQVYDYYHGRSLDAEIVERSDGMISTSDGSPAYFAPYKKWPLVERKAMRFVKGRVLDIGCGAGRVALHLQEKGHEVVGIDTSPLTIDICKKRGVKSAELCSITRIGRHLGIFDTIIMFGNNWGLMENSNRARTILKKMYRMTSPRARMLAETLDPYQTTLPEHLEYQKWNRDHGRMSGQLRLRVRYLKYKTPWFDYLIVSEKEMRNILVGTGWGIKKIIRTEQALYVAVIEKR